MQAGAAGIIVSNHGARQLDYVPATIMALEEVFSLYLHTFGRSGKFKFSFLMQKLESTYLSWLVAGTKCC